MCRIAQRVTQRTALHGAWSTAKTCTMVMAAAALAAGCSQVLGFKDPTVDNTKADAGDAGDAGVDAPVDTPAACMPAACPFGCDPTTNACKEGKLWVFKTAAAFLGNAFGGTDSPPNVRGGADGKCLETYSVFYAALQCDTNRMHAILHVNSADSIPLMATKYAIPTNAPVHRAEDDVLISNNWNDLTDPTKQLRAPATTAATDSEGMVWTGANTVVTCTNWTSMVSTDSGDIGLTSRTDAGWLNEGTSHCDRSASLICVCWSGGN